MWRWWASWPRRRWRAAVLGLVAGFAAAAASAEPLTVPFDFSRGAIVIDVAVKGAPMRMMLDTGADPSVIDLARAVALGLWVDRSSAGEASGEGDAKSAVAYDSRIVGLAIRGHRLAPVEAGAMDLAPLSALYGSKVDGVLGHSFLARRIVLIDYAARSLTILDRPLDAAAETRGCRTRRRIPLRSYEGDTIPIITDFRVGDARMPVSLDTGSNGIITLYRAALDLPGVRASLTPAGDTRHGGFRGSASAPTYTLGAALGFGPFTLPAGAHVDGSDEPGSPTTRLGNVGNRFFAALSLKLLLDYRGRTVTFYGDCR